MIKGDWTEVSHLAEAKKGQKPGEIFFLRLYVVRQARRERQKRQAYYERYVSYNQVYNSDYD